jgi:nuclear cap-binding protein subunit 1
MTLVRNPEFRHNYSALVLSVISFCPSTANPYHDAAQAVLNLLRGRSKAEDVMALLESLKNSLGETVEGDVNIDSVLRAIAIQSLLHIGSRSFSHFLNAVERYLPLLRNLAAGGISSGAGGSPSLEARMDILSASASFWKRNRQMVGIVFDKLMQYQIVDPTDVVAWTFGSRLGNGRGPLKVDSTQWDLLRAALDKANGRVMIARKKVITLRREEDDTRARANATDSADVTSTDVVASMDVEAEAKQGIYNIYH